MTTKKTTTTKSLPAALLQAQQAIGAVGKDARNDFGRYDYVSAEAMIRGSRAALHSAGVLFFEAGTEVLAEGAAVQVSYRLCHPASGEEQLISRDWPIARDLGKGKTKPEDKALAGALTACLSYTLRGLLLIPRVDQADEMDQGDRQEDPREDLTELGRVAKAAMEGKLWDGAQLKQLKATTSAAKGDTMTRPEVARLIKTITTTIGSEYAAKETT